VGAYGQSKSANSLFAVELNKRGQQDVCARCRASRRNPTDLLNTDGRKLSAYGICRETVSPRSGCRQSSRAFQNDRGRRSNHNLVRVAATDREGRGYSKTAISPDGPCNSKLLSGVRPWAVDKARLKLFGSSEKLTSVQLDSLLKKVGCLAF